MCEASIVTIQGTEAGPDSTKAIVSTTADVLTTTAGVSITTTGVSTTTVGVSITTTGVSTTTAGASTTTPGVSTTTAVNPATAKDSTTAGVLAAVAQQSLSCIRLDADGRGPTLALP